MLNYRDLIKPVTTRPVGTSGGSPIEDWNRTREQLADLCGHNFEVLRDLGLTEDIGHAIVTRAFAGKAEPVNR